MPRILVVDDEVVIAIQLAEHLVSMGHDVVGTACSGEESVKMALLLKPDLIVTDIVMPGRLDGIAAAEIIKAKLGTPIIFMTACVNDRLMKRTRKVQPAGYILKPFNEQQLEETIVAAFQK